MGGTRYGAAVLERSSLQVSFRRAALVAAAMLLVSGSAARAADTLTVDITRDGDVDLLATTDGNELVAWFNHGRSRFTSTVIHPRATGPLGPLGPAIERVESPGRIDFGVGDDGALPAAERLSAPCVALLRHLSPPSASQTPVSALY